VTGVQTCALPICQQRHEARGNELLRCLDVFAVDGGVGRLQHEVAGAADADAPDDLGDGDGHDVDEVDVVACGFCSGRGGGGGGRV
jgi:hypothetical protein